MQVDCGVEVNCWQVKHSLSAQLYLDAYGDWH